MPYATPKFVPNDARTTLVMISGYEDKTLSGTITNILYGESIPFRSTVELLFQIDGMLDEFELPKASTSKRSFAPGATGAPPPKTSAAGDTLATFKLKVMFRQNASWQGSIAWVEGGSEAPFRSVLEMLYLIDSALSGNK